MTIRAMWQRTVVAESEDMLLVEGNHYFPQHALEHEYFTPSRTRSLCPWKGIDSFYAFTVDGVTRPDAARQYKHPTPRARKVQDRVSFGGDVEVVDGDDAEVTR